MPISTQHVILIIKLLKNLSVFCIFFNPLTSVPLGINTYITGHTGTLGTGLQNY